MWRREVADPDRVGSTVPVGESDESPRQARKIVRNNFYWRRRSYAERGGKRNSRCRGGRFPGRGEWGGESGPTRARAPGPDGSGTGGPSASCCSGSPGQWNGGRGGPMQSAVRTSGYVHRDHEEVVF